MSDSNSAVKGNSPLANGSADQPPKALSGGSTNTAQLSDPQQGESSRVGKLAGFADGSASGNTKAPRNEEPEPAQELDLPTDGRDEVGEAMIRDLPKRRELSDAPPEPADRHGS